MRRNCRLGWGIFEEMREFFDPTKIQDNIPNSRNRGNLLSVMELCCQNGYVILSWSSYMNCRKITSPKSVHDFNPKIITSTNCNISVYLAFSMRVMKIKFSLKQTERNTTIFRLWRVVYFTRRTAHLQNQSASGSRSETFPTDEGRILVQYSTFWNWLFNLSQ